MSIFASILRSVYKLSGAKKAFALPEDALRKEIEKHGMVCLPKSGLNLRRSGPVCKRTSRISG